MTPPQQTSSVAGFILYVVGIALIAMQAIAIGYRSLSEWNDINRGAETRATAALSLLEAVHVEGMLHSIEASNTDVARATLDGAIAQFSKSNDDMRLWMVMAPSLIDHLEASAARQSPKPRIELPRDDIDRQAIDTARTATGVVDGWIRIARPSILGVGSASHPSCASCHMGPMNLAKGDVVGAYSVAVNLADQRGQWQSRIMFEAVSALGIVLACLGIIAAILNITTLAPLRRITAATRRLAGGNLSVNVAGAERCDEVGTLARSLEVFRNGLLQKRQAEETIAHMVGHDSLTGLLNRGSLMRSLDAAIREHVPGSKIAVASMDLDGLKEINDLYGYLAGDAALKAFADNLTKDATNGEFVARVGGDEFVVVRRFCEQSEVFDFASGLKASLQIDSAIWGKPGQSGHIGIAIWPHDAATTEALLAKADNALQRAKSEKLHCTCYYDAALEGSARRRRQLITSLAGAAERVELLLNYQVQKSINDLTTTGYEALLRWQHPELGLISPAEFIPLAEQYGTIVGIGEWVLRTACREAASWPTPHKIAVNLSPIQLAEHDLPDLVSDVLATTGLDPRRLELEITETAIITGKNALDTLHALKTLNVSIALDDFGRGYSSLETLRSFPFDKIKLDRFFVTELVGSTEAKAIIRAIVALGTSLSIPVLAEGIETQDQLMVLRREGCCEGQGFLFGRPQRFIDFTEDTRHAS